MSRCIVLLLCVAAGSESIIDTSGCDCSWIRKDNCISRDRCATACRTANPSLTPCTTQTEDSHATLPVDAFDCDCSWIRSDNCKNQDRCARACRSANPSLTSCALSATVDSALPSLNGKGAITYRGQQCDCSWLHRDDCKNQDLCATACRMSFPQETPCTAWPVDVDECDCSWIRADNCENQDTCALSCRRANPSLTSCKSHGQHEEGDVINSKGCDCSWIVSDNCQEHSFCANTCRKANPSLTSCTVKTTSPSVDSAENLYVPPVKFASEGQHELIFGRAPLSIFGSITYGYNGKLPGPTFRVKPGETLSVKLTNHLFREDGKPCEMHGPNFCETYKTNLHTHGLHVSTKGATASTAHFGDSVFIEVGPGESKLYDFEVPENHMGGTHWYHPHHHHGTAIQAGGGAAGMLIVEDADGYLPVEYANMVEKVLLISGHNMLDLQKMAQEAGSVLLEDVAKVAERYRLGTDAILVNGMYRPEMVINSHVWHRFRMAFAAVQHSVRLTVHSDNGAECAFKLLAKDGIYLETIPRDIRAVNLYPGSRADVAVSCTCTKGYPCTSTLESTYADGRRLASDSSLAQDLRNADASLVPASVMLVTIKETPGGNVVPLRPTKLSRPCYLVDLRDAEVPAENHGNLEFVGSKETSDAVHWNGKGESMTHSNFAAMHAGMDSWPALTTMKTGSIYEIKATGINKHPMHTHVNPFQIVEMGAAQYEDGYFQVGDWHDTLLLEELPGSMKVRMQTDRFTGREVIHCHILSHEDSGMMGFIDVQGEEGAHWPGARLADSTCYSGAFRARRLTEGSGLLMV